MIRNINSGFTATDFLSVDIDTSLFNDWGRYFPSIESEIVAVPPLSLSISNEHRRLRHLSFGGAEDEV